GRVDEIPPGHMEGKPLVLAHWAGRFFALEGLCPHRQNPLEGAVLWDHLLDCPWHHFQYDIRTGENYFPKKRLPEKLCEARRELRPLRTDRVELRESELWVDLD
ncbi:MAG: Rieske 2Fe-2S domain-containing protein, partial [Acidobacteriota bacterium]|nr:Rieske 2Fe-2S domain-containing protein [Acidobacteriota bacterium]